MHASPTPCLRRVDVRAPTSGRRFLARNPGLRNGSIRVERADEGDRSDYRFDFGPGFALPARAVFAAVLDDFALVLSVDSACRLRPMLVLPAVDVPLGEEAAFAFVTGCVAEAPEFDAPAFVRPLEVALAEPLLS